MSMTANLHNARRARADQFKETAWLEFSDGDNNKIAVFMPFATAEAVAKAFNEAQRAVDDVTA